MPSLHGTSDIGTRWVPFRGRQQSYKRIGPALRECLDSCLFPNNVEVVTAVRDLVDKLESSDTNFLDWVSLLMRRPKHAVFKQNRPKLTSKGPIQLSAHLPTRPARKVFFFALPTPRSLACFCCPMHNPRKFCPSAASARRARVGEVPWLSVQSLDLDSAKARKRRTRLYLSKTMRI